MNFVYRAASPFVFVGFTLLNQTAFGADITDDMRLMARVYATLEARNQKAYCSAMHGVAYVDYLNKVCQSAVQNKVKKSDECSQERIAQEVKADTGKCLAMPPAEFEKTALRGDEGSKGFVKKMAEQGVDGKKLLQDERAKLK